MSDPKGVLLYYKYVDLSRDQEDLRGWMQHLCNDLQLKGRARVAKDGVNVTVWLAKPATCSGTLLVS